MTEQVIRIRKTTRRAAAEKVVTLSDRAYERLKSDIMSGVLPAGSALKLQALSERYQTSFSPVREALNRLQAEQLVTSVPLCGFCVAPYSIEDLRDATSVRIFLEKEAIRNACRLGDDQWEANAVAAYHALSLVWTRLSRKGSEVSSEDVAEMEARHLEFHMALIAACGSPRILTFARQLHAETQRYRQPMLVNTQIGSGPRDVLGEHEAILTAVLAREGEKAAQLLEAHYGRTARTIENRQLQAAEDAS